MRWPVRMRDESLPHQITLNVDNRGRILVGCNCSGEPIEARQRWEGWQAVSAWRTFHQQGNTGTAQVLTTVG